MAARTRMGLRMALYLLIGVLVYFWMSAEERITEETYKLIQVGMTRRDVEAVFGGPSNGVDKVRYQPVGMAAPRYGKLWRGSYMQISILFDEKDNVMSKSWSSRVDESISEKVQRWLHLPWW